MTINQELSEQLKILVGSSAVILGIGNTLKGDDAVGPFLCEQLSGKVCAEVIDAGTVPDHRPHDLVTGYDRQSAGLEVALADLEISATHGTGLDGDEHLTWPRLGVGTVSDDERAGRGRRRVVERGGEHARNLSAWPACRT